VSLKDLNENQKILDGPRKGIKNNEIEVPLRERIPEGLRQTIIDKGLGEKIINMWGTGNASRQNQLERQRTLLLELDEFMEPIYEVPQAWQSDLHLPIAFTICKTFHARMFAALMSQDPPFIVEARKEANTERAPMIQDLMNYTIKDWANNYKGIDNEVDDFIWEWCSMGRSIWKMRWDRQFTRFVDVEERQFEGAGQVVDGQLVPTIETEEVPVKKDEKIFEGPVWEHIPYEDVIMIGGNGDPDRADFIGHSLFMTAHELYTQVDAKRFNKEAVDKIVAGGDNNPMSEPNNNIKADRARASGESSPDAQEILDRYQIIEAYVKLDLDESGVNSDVIVWIHRETREIVRATYLWRVMQTGLTPFAAADFYRRKGQEAAVGLVELIWSLTKEMDAMHNMKIDFGLISSMPIGFYRASSSLSKERLPLEPGSLLPLDDPIRDINFPNLGNRTAFAASEEAAL